MLVISAKEQKSVMKMKEVIDSCALALQEYSAGRTVTPIRSTLPVAIIKYKLELMETEKETIDFITESYN